MQTIREFMTEDIWTIQSTATVREAAQLMAEKDVGFLPVTHEEVSAGVITDRDIVVRAIARNLDPDETTVGAILSAGTPAEGVTTGIATLPESTTIDEAVRQMDEKQIRRAAVIDADYRMIGVVSRADLPQSCVAAHE